MKLRMLIGLMAGALSMLAADINGKWTATMQGRGGQSREVVYNLKADGAKLTGTQSTPNGERELEKGKIDGDTIMWEQTMNMGGESRTMSYTGKVAGDVIKVKMKAGEMEREFEMKRAK
jgi:hypothetical protein